MSRFTTFVGALSQVSPPSLPLAPQQYAPQYQDQLNNVLRLYFSRISDTLGAVVGTDGGRYVDCPNGVFFNTVDQTFAAINTAYPAVFNQTYLNNAISLASSSRVTASVDGVYNVQYSGQLVTSSGSAKTAYVWIRRNGIDIGYSTRAYTLTSNNNQSAVEWAFDIDLGEGEYVEIVMAVTDLAIKLEGVAAAAPHPGIPSSVLSVNFIAPLPNPRPVAP